MADKELLPGGADSSAFEMDVWDSVLRQAKEGGLLDESQIAQLMSGGAISPETLAEKQKLAQEKVLELTNRPFSITDAIASLRSPDNGWDISEAEPPVTPGVRADVPYFETRWPAQMIFQNPEERAQFIATQDDPRIPPGEKGQRTKYVTRAHGDNVAILDPNTNEFEDLDIFKASDLVNPAEIGREILENPELPANTAAGVLGTMGGGPLGGFAATTATEGGISTAKELLKTKMLPGSFVNPWQIGTDAAAGGIGYLGGELTGNFLSKQVALKQAAKQMFGTAQKVATQTGQRLLGTAMKRIPNSQQLATYLGKMYHGGVAMAKEMAEGLAESSDINAITLGGRSLLGGKKAPARVALAELKNEDPELARSILRRWRFGKRYEAANDAKLKIGGDIERFYTKHPGVRVELDDVLDSEGLAQALRRILARGGKATPAAKQQAAGLYQNYMRKVAELTVAGPEQIRDEFAEKFSDWLSSSLKDYSRLRNVHRNAVQYIRNPSKLFADLDEVPDAAALKLRYHAPSVGDVWRAADGYDAMVFGLGGDKSVYASLSTQAKLFQKELADSFRQGQAVAIARSVQNGQLRPGEALAHAKNMTLYGHVKTIARELNVAQSIPSLNRLIDLPGSIWYGAIGGPIRQGIGTASNLASHRAIPQMLKAGKEWIGNKTSQLAANPQLATGLGALGQVVGSPWGYSKAKSWLDKNVSDDHRTPLLPRSPELLQGNGLAIQMIVANPSVTPETKQLFVQAMQEGPGAQVTKDQALARVMSEAPALFQQSRFGFRSEVQRQQNGEMVTFLMDPVERATYLKTLEAQARSNPKEPALAAKLAKQQTKFVNGDFSLIEEGGRPRATFVTPTQEFGMGGRIRFSNPPQYGGAPLDQADKAAQAIETVVGPRSSDPY